MLNVFKVPNTSCVLQRYSRPGRNGQLLLEIAVVGCQVACLCSAAAYSHVLATDPPNVPGIENFYVYDHVANAPARPLNPKKIEPATPDLILNATLADLDYPDAYVTCPTEVADDYVPRWSLPDDETGLERFRDQQVL